MILGDKNSTIGDGKQEIIKPQGSRGNHHPSVQGIIGEEVLSERMVVETGCLLVVLPYNHDHGESGRVNGRVSEPFTTQDTQKVTLH